MIGVTARSPQRGNEKRLLPPGARRDSMRQSSPHQDASHTGRGLAPAATGPMPDIGVTA